MNLNWTEIALAVIAILASVVTHQLDKRKHKIEVEKLKAETQSDNIDNMDKSLDFYEKLAEATNKRLDDVLARQEVIIKENENLKSQIADVNSKMKQLTSVICTKLSCVYREVDDSVIDCVYPIQPTKRRTRRKIKTEKV